MPTPLLTRGGVALAGPAVAVAIEVVVVGAGDTDPLADVAAVEIGTGGCSRALLHARRSVPVRMPVGDRRIPRRWPRPRRRRKPRGCARRTRLRSRSARSPSPLRAVRDPRLRFPVRDTATGGHSDPDHRYPRRERPTRRSGRRSGREGAGSPPRGHTRRAPACRFPARLVGYGDVRRSFGLRLTDDAPIHAEAEDSNSHEEDDHKPGRPWSHRGSPRTDHSSASESRSVSDLLSRIAVGAHADLAVTRGPADSLPGPYAPEAVVRPLRIGVDPVPMR